MASFFFFQAEDGIRDGHVTGVQTCALPISEPLPPPHLVGERARALDVLAGGGLVCASAAAVAEPLPPPDQRPEPIQLTPGAELSLEDRSEERRVGKECRRGAAR